MKQKHQNEVIATELNKAPKDGVLIAACRAAENAKIVTEIINVDHTFAKEEKGNRIHSIHISIALPSDCVLQEDSSMKDDFNEAVLKQLIESLFGYYDVCASEVDSDEE